MRVSRRSAPQPHGSPPITDSHGSLRSQAVGYPCCVFGRANRTDAVRLCASGEELTSLTRTRECARANAHVCAKALQIHRTRKAYMCASGEGLNSQQMRSLARATFLVYSASPSQRSASSPHARARASRFSIQSSNLLCSRPVRQRGRCKGVAIGTAGRGDRLRGVRSSMRELLGKPPHGSACFGVASGLSSAVPLFTRRSVEGCFTSLAPPDEVSARQAPKKSGGFSRRMMPISANTRTFANSRFAFAAAGSCGEGTSGSATSAHGSARRRGDARSRDALRACIASSRVKWQHCGAPRKSSVRRSSHSARAAHAPFASIMRHARCITTATGEGLKSLLQCATRATSCP